MIPFVTPKEIRTFENSEGEEVRIINDRAYKARIKGYNKIRWALIIRFKMSKAEVDNLSLDELFEAYYAAELFSEEEKEASEADT